MRNRIINGAMVIDQRNAGASVTPSNSYTLDRWKYENSQTSKFTVQQDAGAVTLPVGFTDYLGATSSSAYSITSSDYFNITQFIEGYNVSDLGWGTANAKTVTLSFWVRSSLTGTFGGSIQNSASNRSYPFTYTISAANTWEYETITITGDTSGTWLTTNGVGLRLYFGLGVGSTFSGTAGAWAGSNFVSATGATSVVGTNGATFYITGVQLEVGTQATSFEYRQYQQELSLCQRYYQRVAPTTGFTDMAYGYCANTTETTVGFYFRTSMRAAPSALETTGTAANYAISHSGTNTTCNAVPVFGSSTTELINIGANVASGLTSGRGCSLRSASGVTTAFLAWSAEL
jgi:hypothetical protein